MRYSLLAIVALAAAFSGCTTPLTEAGSHVELITPAKSAGCEMMKLFPVRGSSPDDAVNKALNQVAEMGGDSAGISEGKQVDGHSEITAVALKCRK